MTKEQLNNDLKEAMRNKDNTLRDTVRLLLTTIKNAEIEKGGELTEGELAVLFQKQAKQRRDSIAAFQQGGREDLAAAEQAELEIIERYLPPALSEEEVRAEVRAEIARQGATSAKEMGKVIGPLMKALAGQVDGATVQRLVREELSA